MNFLKKVLVSKVTSVILEFLSVAGLFFVIFFIDPEMEIFPFSSIIFLCLALFGSVFFVTQAIVQRFRVSLIVGFFVVANIILRYFGFKDYLYTLILLVLFVLLSMLLRRNGREARRKEKTNR